jgi:FKBP-type peptidyl-prolyl cis-trans isomerase FkpA
MKQVAFVLGLMLATSASAANKDAKAAPKGDAKAEAKATNAKGAPLKTDEEKTLYALGAILGQKMQVFKLSPTELEVVQRGISDQVRGAPLLVEMDTWGPKVNDLQEARRNELLKANSQSAVKEEEKGKAYRDTAGKEKGAEVTPSGLVFKVLEPGSGPQPKATDTVKVDYEGKLIDGKVFDSSIKRGQPVSFPLDQVIPCWTEGVQKMHVGEKAQLVCPAKIAYGDNGAGSDIPPGATLVFEVHLLAIEGAH